MWAGRRLSAALLPAAASSPLPTWHRQLWCPLPVSPHRISSGRQPQAYSSLHPHWDVGCHIFQLYLEVSGFHPFGSSGCKKFGVFSAAPASILPWMVGCTSEEKKSTRHGPAQHPPPTSHPAHGYHSYSELQPLVFA